MTMYSTNISRNKSRRNGYRIMEPTVRTSRTIPKINRKSQSVIINKEHAF